MDFNLASYHGVGPAGQIVRLIQLYTVALAKNESFNIDEETADWWESCFQSRFYRIKSIGKVQHNIGELLRVTFPNPTNRKLAIKEAAKQILIFNPEIAKPFDFDYYCIYRRGTDKITERCFYPGCLFKEALAPIQKVSSPIVVVSDSQYLIDEMKEYFPHLLTTETIKSNDEKPLHLHSKRSKKEILRDCLIDSLTLSNSTLLIYSHSMMINLAFFMNNTLEGKSVETMVDERLREILNSCTDYFRFRERQQ